MIDAVVLVKTVPISFGIVTDEEAMMRVFSYPADRRESLFADSFLNQVPIGRVNDIISQYKSNLGTLEEVRGGENKYTLLFERGTAPGRISLDTEGRIVGLWFGNWTLKSDTLEKLVSELKKLDGSVSLFISKNGKELCSLNGEDLMAVGSTFKLYVLKALYDKLDPGSWRQVLWLKKEDISLPSGILQNWPVGTPLTVKSLSNLMIARSDNTATDILIDLVGKKYLEEGTNSRNNPFLTTVEAFNLKYGVDEKTQKEYLSGNKKTKRKILEDLQGLRVSARQVSDSIPKLIDEIEWFFSTRRLAELIYDLREAGEIYIDPGLARGPEWYRAGYKGGSEGGVTQYTYLLQKTKKSPIYAFSLTVNNPEKGLNTERISEITARLISLVQGGKL